MITRVKTLYKRIIARAVLFTAGAILSTILFFSSFILFLFIAKYVFLEGKEEFDQRAFEYVGAFTSESTTRLMSFVTFFGNYHALVTANVLLIAYFLFIRRNKWYSIKIPAIALSSLVIMSLLKIWFNRPRPLIPLVEPAHGLSFPSGHAMSSVTFFGLLIFFIYRRHMKGWIKTVLIGALLLFIFMIGFSRVYLRVHYASDVLAGFCAGIIWLIISISILRRIELYSQKRLKGVVDVQAGGAGS
ncbi:phosphatase PAP2 family protein [Pedobacter sp. SYSU D00535]|uniref:phosphatase PAP2 family protein n=1 Tax=Pedobacter sp. SYSU D00535 TaxID=2810308 RepID=UPI001A96AFAD|nr:phosphatase PAP2 family protein [Pedobacter sp. SYSU D00535]